MVTYVPYFACLPVKATSTLVTVLPDNATKIASSAVPESMLASRCQRREDDPRAAELVLKGSGRDAYGNEHGVTPLNVCRRLVTRGHH